MLKTKGWLVPEEAEDGSIVVIDKDYDVLPPPRPATTNDFVFEIGKHSGETLSNVIDVGYLQWCRRADGLHPVYVKVIEMRLKELE